MPLMKADRPRHFGKISKPDPPKAAEKAPKKKKEPTPQKVVDKFLKSKD